MNQLLLTKLKSQHREIYDLLATISPDLVEKRPQPNKWSIFENLAHLGRYQEVFLQRLLLILSQENPELGRYKAEDDPGFHAWHNLEQAQVIQKLEQNRLDLVVFFENLAAKDWERTGNHPVLGALSVRDWLHFFLLHESHHLYTIFKIKHTT